MDYYSFDSEVIESMNVLRPPVKRDPRYSNKVCSEYYNNHSINYSGVQRDLNQNNKCHEEDGNSSTSLILKKTSERQIFNQDSTTSYQIFNSQAPHETKHTDKNKPLIKVTVIPKSEREAGIKLLRKHRIRTKTIQATSSNHENSIQTNSVYLVVAGRKKDKIYEIKTTGSVNFKPELIKDGTVASDCNFEQFSRTNDMERKKKKFSKKEAKSDKQNKAQAGCDNMLNIEHLCDCLAADEEHYDVKGRSYNYRSEDEVVHDVRTGKSRVRIFGRLGITEGDQYVLNCQATVDDKPVPISSSSGENKYDKPTLRDFVMQTENRNNTINKLLMDDDIKNKASKDSQTTQVNFNNPNDNNKNRFTFCTTNQSTECNCPNENPANRTVNTEHEETKNLKSRQHPLVIISVFPKQDPKSHFEQNENDDNNFANLVKTVQCAQIENLTNALNRQIFPENNPVICDTPDENDSEMTKSKTKNVRGRSPPPRRPKTKPKENKTFETIKLKKSNARNEIPVRVKIPKKEQRKGTNSPKQTLQFYNSNIIKEPKEASKKTRNLGPFRSPSAKSPVTNSNKREPRHRKSKSPNRKVDKGINTEHLEAKKALVASYTKTICEQMASSKDKPPATRGSKISVNIDNDKEFYDVSFRQDKFTTDLNVRKTMKEASVQKYCNENRKHGSMENFFPKISKKQHNSRICQSICENQSDDVDSIVNTTRRLTLQDSIELLQRREDKNMKNTQTTKHITENIDVMDFIAPIKHFTGDNCTICNPVDRDREIRELLGVETRRANAKVKDSHIHDFEIGDQISRHCFYPDQCKKKYVADFSVQDDEFSCPYISNNKCCDTDCHCSRESLREIDDEIEHAENIRYCNQRHRSVISGPTSGIKFIVKQKTKDNQINNCQMTVNLETDTARKIDCSCNTDKEYLYDRRRMVAHNTYADETNGYQTPAKNEKSDLKATSLYQHLTLNRNIQVFLQVDQFNKEKPIALTRKQYKKVKRTIQNTLMTKEKRCSCIRSLLSLGAVREKYREGKNVPNNKEEFCQKSIHISKDTQTKKYLISDDTEVVKEFTETNKEYIRLQKDKDTVVLFSNEARDGIKEKKPPKVSERQAVSSVEVRYSNVEYLKHVTFSTTNMGSIGSSSYANRNHYSIETLFRGHRKSATPNLGTSALSLVSETHISRSQSLKISPPDAKAKKPFLKRLMSCLVMRSSKASEMKMKTERQPQSVNSSIDSYHISTSFGAIEMTSSLYDTSVSFCSDHSIHPLSSKLKRGFLTSVIGFLTSRKS